MKLTFALIAILGYILNVNNHKMMSYAVWFISNSLWALYSLYNGEYELASMFASYNIFTIYGILKEIKKRKNGSYLLQFRKK